MLPRHLVAHRIGFGGVDAGSQNAERGSSIHRTGVQISRAQ
jgi:hypothetical protein